MKPQTMRRVYLREAAVMLVLARLAVRFLPSARLFAWADRPTRHIRRFAADEAQWIAWAIDHVGALPAMNALCLPRALGRACDAAAARHCEQALPGRGP